LSLAKNTASAVTVASPWIGRPAANDQATRPVAASTACITPSPLPTYARPSCSAGGA
jgi:hypothetical protein